MTTPTRAQPSKTVLLSMSILLFFIVFAQWQIYDFIMMNVSLEPNLNLLIYVLMPAISLIIYALFVKLIKSEFGKHGYTPPHPITTEKCLAITLVLVAIYILGALAPGVAGSIGPLHLSLSPWGLAYRIANATLFALATESIFRGYIFRNLLTRMSFFPSLYLSSLMFSVSQISVRNLSEMGIESLMIYVFTDILTAFAAGLFLGYFFYKTGLSILGPAVFRMGVLFYFEPDSITSVGSIWWMRLTFEVATFAFMILLLDILIKEPEYRRRKYGLES